MKNILLFLAFSCSVLISVGQKMGDTAYVLHYNFLNGRLEMPKHVNWHPPAYRPFVIRIDSINRGAFKIKITAKDSILATSDPSQFTTAFSQLEQVKPQISKQASADPKLPGDSTEQSDTTKGTSKPKATKAAAKKKGNVAKQADSMAIVKTSIATMKKTNTGIVINNLSSTIPKEDVSEYMDLVNLGRPTDSLLKKNLPDAKFKNATISEDTVMRRTIYNNLNSSYKKLRFSKYALLRIADSISYSITQIERSMLAMKHHFMTKNRFEKEYKMTDDSLRKQLLFAKTIYQKVPPIANELKAWQKMSAEYFDDTIFKLIDDAELKNVEEIYTSIHVDSLLHTLDRINLALNYLGADEFYRFTSPPITPFGDLIIVNVSIQAIDKKDSTQPDDEKTYELKLFTKNRFRFDFSTGLGTLFNLTDKAYHFQSIGSDSVNIIENINAQKITPIIAAFLHAGYDIGASVKPAITLGLSLNASSFDLTTILVGGSVMFGRDDKLVLSGGWAMKKINVLKSDFKAGTTYAKIDVGSTVPTESVFHSGGFISISYNLTYKQSQK